MSEQQIFIVGTGRSGTSILKRILGNHSKIFSYPKELRFISDRNGIMDLRNSLTRDWNPHNADKIISEFYDLMTNEIFKNQFHEKYLTWVYKKVLSGSGKKYYSVNLSDFTDYRYLLNTLDRFIGQISIDRVQGYWYGAKSYQLSPHMYITKPLKLRDFDKKAGQFLDNLLSYPLDSRDENCWCEDTPMNILYADILANMMENAKIVHIYRNPLDVISSYSDNNQKWAPNNIKYSAIWVKKILTKWQNISNNISSKKLIEIKYENLVNNQIKGLSKVIDFLNLEFEDSLMNIKLNNNSIGRHKTNLSTNQLDEIKSDLMPVLDQYGYT